LQVGGATAYGLVWEWEVGFHAVDLVLL
jgi:hypothetical protein